MEFRPDRGRIIVVNFEKGGSAIPPEMRKTMRPCIVVQNNKLKRGRLVTVVPLSSKPPMDPNSPHTHQMDHRSFIGWPLAWGGQGTPRYAQCEYVATISWDRCSNPYSKSRERGRVYTKVKAIKVDMEAIDRCVLWGLGIDPAKYVT